MTKLLILSSDTGEGHNSAAAAIYSAATTAGLAASIRKPVEESSAINRGMGKIYNILLRRKPEWMKNYLSFIDRVRPNDQEWMFRLVRNYIGRLIHSENPDIVLSVHPMLNHFIQRYIKEERPGVPCYTFVTDPFPPFWRGWSSPHVDRYFVTREEASQALCALNVDPQRIDRVPMPVRPQFKPATMSEIQEFRHELQLDAAATILINGGARGGGPIREIYETVRKATPESNILVVCGRNAPLRSQLERMRDPKARIFGFVTDIHRYIAASDLVLTKPGAMSTYEALACHVPVVLLGICALMPQESGMFEAATRYNFGFSASTFADLDRIIRLGSHEWNRKRPLLTEFSQTSTGEELIERIQPVHAPA